MKFLRALLYLIALPALVVVLLGYFGSVHASLDTLAHFRVHMAVLAAVCGLLLALMRRKAVGFLVLFWALLPLAFHMDFFGGKSPGETVALVRGLLPVKAGTKSDRLSSAPAASPRYRLVHANLRFDNPDPKGFLRLAGEAGADVMTLNEVSQLWLPQLETLKAAYPNQLVCTGNGKIGGVAIVSKRPFLDDALNGCSNDGVLALQRIDFGGREVLIGAAHLHWPWPSPQAQQITQMRDRLRKAGDASGGLVFAGDLNAAPWSHSAERIANFLNARPVTVPWGSWAYHTLPADYAWLGLPLDNVFARGVTVTSAKRGVPFGSDHLPVVIEFSIEETPEKETK